MCALLLRELDHPIDDGCQARSSCVPWMCWVEIHHSVEACFDLSGVGRAICEVLLGFLRQDLEKSVHQTSFFAARQR